MDTTLRTTSALPLAGRLLGALQHAWATWEQRRSATAAAAVLHRLAPRHVTHLDLPAGSQLCVDSGRLWVTTAGDPADHFVAMGGAHSVVQRTRVVVECDSLDAAVFRVLPRR